MVTAQVSMASLQIIDDTANAIILALLFASQTLVCSTMQYVKLRHTRDTCAHLQDSDNTWLPHASCLCCTTGTRYWSLLSLPNNSCDAVYDSGLGPSLLAALVLIINGTWGAQAQVCERQPVTSDAFLVRDSGAIPVYCTVLTVLHCSVNLLLCICRSTTAWL